MAILQQSWRQRVFTREFITVCALMAVANLFYNMLPVFLNESAGRLKLSEAQVGYLGSTYLAGQMLFNLGGLAWLNRVSWKLVLGMAIAVKTVALLVAMHAGYGVSAAAYFVIGGACGALFTCLFCAIGRSHDPKRLYGAAIVAHTTLSGLTVYATTVEIMPRFGAAGLYWAVAALLILAYPAVGAFRAPPAGTDAATPLAGAPRRRLRLAPMVGLLGVLIYFIGQTAFWAFLSRIGASNGVSDIAVGQVIAIVLVASGFAALLPSLIGDRLGVALPLIIGSNAFVASMWLLAHGHSMTAFGVALMVQSSAWNFVVPYQMEAIAKVDVDGAYSSQLPAAQAVGGTLGPALGGILIVGANFSLMYAMAAVTAIVSMVLILWVYRKHRAFAAGTAQAV